MVWPWVDLGVGSLGAHHMCGPVQLWEAGRRLQVPGALRSSAMVLAPGPQVLWGSQEVRQVKHQCRASLKEQLARVTVLKAGKKTPGQSWEQSHNGAELGQCHSWTELGITLQLSRAGDSPTAGQSWGHYHNWAKLGPVS